MVHDVLTISLSGSHRWMMSLPRADFKMVLGEEDGEIPQNFGSVRLVGGESLVAHRTVFSKDSKYVIYVFIYVSQLGQDSVVESVIELFVCHSTESCFAVVVDVYGFTALQRAIYYVNLKDTREK